MARRSEAAPAPPILENALRVVRGRIVREGSHEPIPNGRVWLARGDQPRASPSSVATADAEGRFELQAERDAIPLVLFAQVPGYRFWSKPLADLPVDDGWVRVELPSRSVIRGVVVDPAGSPIPGVRVQARGVHAEDVGWLPDPVGWWSDQAPELAEGLSGADGSFVLSGLEPAEYELHTWKDGYAPSALPAGSPPKAVAGSDSVVRVVLEPLYEVWAQAVDGETGEPLDAVAFSGALVAGKPWVYSGTPGFPPRGGRASSWQEEATGSYRIRVHVHDREGDLRKTVQVRARAYGYDPQEADVTPVLWGTAKPTQLRMRRSGDREFTQVTFRLVVGEGLEGPTGVIPCIVGTGGLAHQSPWIPQRFERGVTVQPLALPPGSYTVSVRGGTASLGLWRTLSGKRPTAFRVGGEPSLVVDIPCPGGVVCVCPTLPTGVAVSEYGISVESSQTGGQCMTWSEMIPFEECSCGADGASTGHRFWLPAGVCKLWVFKPGYATAVTEVNVLPGGEPLSWQPVLRRQPAR